MCVCVHLEGASALKRFIEFVGVKLDLFVSAAVRYKGVVSDTGFSVSDTGCSVSLRIARFSFGEVHSVLKLDLFRRCPNIGPT